MKLARPSIISLGLCVAFVTGCAEGPPQFTQAGFTGPTKKADLDDCWRRVNAAKNEGETASDGQSEGGLLGLFGIGGEGDAKTPYELREAHKECMRKRGYEVDGDHNPGEDRASGRKPLLNAVR